MLRQEQGRGEWSVRRLKARRERGSSLETPEEKGHRLIRATERSLAAARVWVRFETVTSYMAVSPLCVCVVLVMVGSTEWFC